MFSRLNINAKGLILVLVPVIIEICFASYLTLMLTDTFTKLVRMQHSIDAMEGMNEKRSQLYAALCVVLDASEPDTAKRLRALDGIDIELTPLLVEKNDRFPEFSEFREAMDTFHNHVKEITKKFRKQLTNPDLAGNYRTVVKDNELMPVLIEANGINSSAFSALKQLGALQPHEMERFQTEFFAWLIISLISSWGICLWISLAFSSDIVKRLRNITENARLISYGQPLHEVQPGTDEIAQLDKTVYLAGKELEELRERELAVLDNATDVLCSVDGHLRLRDIGKAATRNWGFELDELAGRSILSILTEETIEPTRNQFTAIEAESKEGQIENTVKCRDGTTKIFLWTVNWQPTAQLFYCVAHDVSHLRAMEKLKQDFLAMVSHDLRTPLNSVSIGLSMLAENRLGELPASAQSQLSKSRKSVERLSHLVHDLLELEKLGSGKITFDREVASAAEVCGYAKEALEVLAESAHVQLVGPAGDAAILVDVKRLTQVLVNLLSNAIKFSPVNSTVVLDVKEASDYIEIGVSDSGPGIAPEHQSVIFNRFQQVGVSPTKTIKSTGLGLAIVQVIIGELGGLTGVESALGKGSRFWVRVPRLLDDEEAP